MPEAARNTVVVTGDIVRDCHLYGGVKPTPTSPAEPGTVYGTRLGAAALTHDLIKAASDAAGAAWDAAKQPSGPRPTFDVHFGLDNVPPENKLPTHLQSYTVWNARPQGGGGKDTVWRIADGGQVGWGPTDRSTVYAPCRKAHPRSPRLTVIDDCGILFRHAACREAWPELADSEHVLLKFSPPLCRGDLWAGLGAVMDRLIILVSAADLRGEDAQICSSLSWEQCAEDTVRALENDPVVRQLLRAAHVIVSFQSSGALWFRRGEKGQTHKYRLFFDPASLEGDGARHVLGTVLGSQTCLAAAIAFYLARPDGGDFAARISQGVTTGLGARRELLRLGHGVVGKGDPGFPVNAIGAFIAKGAGGFSSVDVGPAAVQGAKCQWTILEQAELAVGNSPGEVPLLGLAQLLAQHGPDAISHVPAYKQGDLFTVDRHEIESFRIIEGLMRAYEAGKVQKKPLSIGVFGPPGAGKSFGVKALARSILSDKVPFIEFNLSQFKSPDELIGAFHRVRDAVLGGVTPVAFWDEFDAQEYRWLQYLLAPMQDGTFQEGQITHPIGKCIFVFAGGTAPSLHQFGVKEPPELTHEELGRLTPDERREHRDAVEHYQGYKLRKGPDFISRLHGFLNVVGPNPRLGGPCVDVTWPLRRAIMLRGILRLKAEARLDIDPGLLRALLGVSRYNHGARSFEKILLALQSGGKRLNRSSLPPDPLLSRETDAAQFRRLLTECDMFKNYPDLEALAAAVHYSFLEGARKSELEAARRDNASIRWKIHPDIQREYDQLSADAKAANHAAAQRVPDHLALIGFVIEARPQNDDGTWRPNLAAAIDKHVDRLAQAEHLGWCAERIANGWTRGARDNQAKRHPLLVEWKDLSAADQEKDRHFVRGIPDLLEIAGFRAVPVSPRKQQEGT